MMRSFIMGYTSAHPTATNNFAYISSNNIAWAVAETRNVDTLLPMPVRVRRMRLWVDVAPGVGTSIAYTLRRNSADTPLTFVLADTNTNAGDSAHPVVYGPGDSIAFRGVPSGSPAAPLSARWYLELESDISFPIFGSNSTAPSNSVQNWMGLQTCGGTWQTPVTNIEQVCPIACTLRNLYVQHGATTSPGTLDFAITKNGVATALVVTGITSNNIASNIISQATFSPGDTWAFQVTPNSTPNVSSMRWSVECIPNVLGKGIVLYGSAAVPSTSAASYEQPNGRGTGAWNTTETTRWLPVPDGYTLTDFYQKISAAAGATKQWQAVVRRNLANSALANVLADPATTGNITGQSVGPTSDGDQLSFSFVPTGTPTGMAAHMGMAVTGPNSPHLPALCA